MIPMKIADMLKYSAKSLAHSKLRTWLTIIGIVIGISSVIVLVSIGEGLNHYVSEQLSLFGAATIVVTPMNLQNSNPSFGGPNMQATSGKLFEKDADELRKVAGVELVSEVINQRAGVGFRGKNITASVSGIEPGVYKEVFKDVVISEGRYLSDSDRGAAVLGNDIAEKSFGKDKVGVNSYIDIAGEKYRVVGILNRTGNSFASVDSVIFITYQDAKDLFGSRLQDKEVNAIVLKAREGFDVDEVAEEVEERLRSTHGVREGEEDFGLVTPSFINGTIGSITSMLTVFLGAIAAISLLVGGVGITNTMFMAVVERTKEIGTLKAIGASEREILSIFLIESGMIGAIGGVLGIAFALLLLLLVKGFGAPVYLDPYVIGGASVFAFMVGVASGFVPARNAARVSPLEALRYE